ncbi:MAG: hypothetical protein KatS3mg083_627 [Candidatus Dojkabacteria bacterium]|nr:MAG: hypothetical protein KatS3mg083_627 [Candidatus Dojkabacteria bacterium]
MISCTLPVRLGDPDSFIVNSKLFDTFGFTYCTEYFYWTTQMSWYYNCSGQKVCRAIMCIHSPFLSTDWFFDSDRPLYIIFRSMPTLAYGCDGNPKLAIGLFDYENKNKLDFELGNFSNEIIAHHDDVAFFNYYIYGEGDRDRIELNYRANCYVVMDYLIHDYTLGSDISALIKDVEKLDSCLRTAFSNCDSERLLTGIIPVYEDDHTFYEITFVLDLLYTYPARVVFKIYNRHKHGLNSKLFPRFDTPIKFFTNMEGVTENLSIRPGRKPGERVLRLDGFEFSTKMYVYGLRLDNFRDVILYNKLKIAKTIYRRIRNKIKKLGNLQVGELKVI